MGNYRIHFFVLGGLFILLFVFVDFERKTSKRYKSVCFETEISKMKVVPSKSRGIIETFEHHLIWSDCDFVVPLGAINIDYLFNVGRPFYVSKKANSDTLFVYKYGEVGKCILRFFCAENE